MVTDGIGAMLCVDAEEENVNIFPYDYYCRNCRKYFSDDDVLEMVLDAKSIGYSVLKFCPICKERGLIPVCQECHDGLMAKPLEPTGGDFDRDGRVEPFCVHCGMGYEKVIIHFCHIMKKANLSKRKIRKAIDKVFTHKGLPYNGKKYVEKLVFGSDITEDNVVNVVSSECHEDKDFIREHLRK